MIIFTEDNKSLSDKDEIIGTISIPKTTIKDGQEIDVSEYWQIVRAFCGFFGYKVTKNKYYDICGKHLKKDNFPMQYVIDKLTWQNTFFDENKEPKTVDQYMLVLYGHKGIRVVSCGKKHLDSYAIGSLYV